MATEPHNRSVSAKNSGEISPDDSGGGVGAPADATSGYTTLNPGDKIDKYEIVRQIGAGGMSIVWKAYDRLLDLHVAIKQLIPELQNAEDGQLHERFRQEARIQKKLATGGNHLTRIIDFIDEKRGLFIVMEYVKGRSLAQLLADSPKPMDERQALGIVGATAIALDAIHRRDVLHRDLKPSNILLPDKGGLKICDFGLAALFAEKDTLELGTVRYMAPELLQSGEVDGRTDIYSLGMIAYELLAGREGFDRAFKIVLRDQRHQALRWMKWHCNLRAKATPLSQVNPQVSETMSELIARMIEKDPSLRIASATELLEAIRRHFSGAGQGATPNDGQVAEAVATAAVVGSSDPTAPLPRPSGLRWILVAVFALQLLLGGGFWLVHYQRTARDRADRHKVAQADYRQAKVQYDVGQYAGAQKSFEELAQQWDQNTKIGSASRARALMSKGQLELAANRYQEAIKAFQDAEALDVLSAEEVQTLIRDATSRRAFADIISQIQDLTAQKHFGEATQKIQETRGYELTLGEEEQLEKLGSAIQDQLRQAKITNVLERAGQTLAGGEREAAIAMLKREQLKFRSPRIKELFDRLLVEVLFDKALAQADQAEDAGNFKAAIAALDRAAKIRSDPELDNRIKQNKGRIYYRQARQREDEGDVTAARILYRRSQDFRDSPEVRQALARLKTTEEKAELVRAGNQAVDAQEFEAAIAHFQRALELGTDSSVRTSLTQARIMLHLQRAQRWIQQKQLTRAGSEVQSVLTLAPGNLPAFSMQQDIRRLTQYQKHLDAGDVAREQSRFGDAKRAYGRARNIRATEEVKLRLDDTEFDHLLARASHYINRERWEVARAHLATAASIRMTEQVARLLAQVAEHLPEEAQE